MSTGDFLVNLVGGGCLGAFAGACIVIMAPAIPAASAYFTTGVCAEMGVTSAGAVSLMTKGVIGLGYASIASNVAFTVDQSYAMGSGNSFLLNKVFQNNQDWYDLTFMTSQMLNMGYLDMSIKYRAYERQEKIGIVMEQIEDDETSYKEFNALKTPEERYQYLLNKAKTMDVSTAKNGSIFYAGQVKRIDDTLKARQMAEKYADQLFENKGVVKLTLERTPGGKWMDNLHLYEQLPDGTYRYESLGLTKDQVDNLWSTLSGRYAEGASGAVTAFTKNVPDCYKSKTVFYTTELPTLRANYS